MRVSKKNVNDLVSMKRVCKRVLVHVREILLEIYLYFCQDACAEYPEPSERTVVNFKHMKVAEVSDVFKTCRRVQENCIRRIFGKIFVLSIWKKRKFFDLKSDKNKKYLSILLRNFERFTDSVYICETFVLAMPSYIQFNDTQGRSYIFSQISKRAVWKAIEIFKDSDLFENFVEFILKHNMVDDYMNTTEKRVELNREMEWTVVIGNHIVFFQNLLSDINFLRNSSENAQMCAIKMAFYVHFGRIFVALDPDHDEQKWRELRRKVPDKYRVGSVASQASFFKTLRVMMQILRNYSDDLDEKRIVVVNNILFYIVEILDRTMCLLHITVIRHNGHWDFYHNCLSIDSGVVNFARAIRSITQVETYHNTDNLFSRQKNKYVTMPVFLKKIYDVPSIKTEMVTELFYRLKIFPQMRDLKLMKKKKLNTMDIIKK